MFVPDKLIVRGDASATAGNVVAHQMLFRSGTVADLIGTVMFICLGTALYRLLSGVNEAQARLMVAFVLVSSAIAFMNEVNNLAALILFRGADFLSTFSKGQLESLGMLFIRLHGQGTAVNEIFWGVWLLPFGVLVYKSRFLPASSACGSSSTLRLGCREPDKLIGAAVREHGLSLRLANLLRRSRSCCGC